MANIQEAKMKKTNNKKNTLLKPDNKYYASSEILGPYIIYLSPKAWLHLSFMFCKCYKCCKRE